MAAITFPVLGLLLLTRFTTAALGESHNGICKRQYLVAATSTDTGTLLYLSTSEPNNFTLEVPNRFLPTQCGENYKLCDVLLIEMESEVIVFVPSQGGFVMVTYQVGELPLYTFHTVDRNCNPVKAFLNSEYNRIVIMCVELSGETNGSLLFVEFKLKERIIVRSSEEYFLRSSSALSEAVYAFHRLTYHIFFTDIDDLKVTDADASSSLLPENIHIDNCTHTNQIDVTENDVSIYCTQNNDSWTVLADSSIPIHNTYSRYPCPGLNQYVRVENKRQIMFGNSTQQSFVGELPDNIKYAACLGAEDSFVFWALTESRQLLSVPLTTENHIITNLSACTNEDNNCLRPSFDASKTSGAYFNYETNQVHITNITSSCGHRTVNMSGTPDLLRLTLGEKEDNCSCANEIPTTEAEAEVSSTLVIIIVVSVVSVVGVGILLFVIIIIICVAMKYCKCSCKCSCNPFRRNVSDVEVVDLEVVDLVQPTQVEDHNGAGSDVVGGCSNSHPRENFDPLAVAEINNAKSRGEDNQNRSVHIARQTR